MFTKFKFTHKIKNTLKKDLKYLKLDLDNKNIQKNLTKSFKKITWIHNYYTNLNITTTLIVR